MKFFIFTCLVAVALAKHVVKDQSNEESTRIYQGKYKQANDVFFQTAQVSASSSSSEESAEEINDKIVQTEEQKVNLNEQGAGIKLLQTNVERKRNSNVKYSLDYSSTFAQHFALYKKIKPFSQDLSCSQFCAPVSQQQINLNQWAQGKAIRNIPNQESISIIVQEILKKIIDLIKSNQIHQFTIPQFPQAVHQQQMPVSYWNRPYTYPYAPYVRYC